MSRFGKIVILLLSVAVVCVLCAIAGLLAQRYQLIPQGLIPTTANFQVPSQIQNLGCDSKGYLQKADPLFQKFDDESKLASSTPRMSLAPLISNMQDTRREFQTIEAPSCASVFKKHVTLFMDNTIDGFIAFLGQQPDYQVQGYFKDALRWQKEAIEEAKRMQ